MATLSYTPVKVAPISHRIIRNPRLDYLLLSFLCAFLFFYGLNVGELYRTESLRAIVAAEFCAAAIGSRRACMANPC